MSELINESASDARIRAEKPYPAYWPWSVSHDGMHLPVLPALPENGYDVQVFVRVDCEPAWRCTITLNGKVVGVPIQTDRQTGRTVAMLPVPSPHVTVRRHAEVLDGYDYTRIEVTTE